MIEDKEYYVSTFAHINDCYILALMNDNCSIKCLVYYQMDDVAISLFSKSFEIEVEHFI